ncbi:uncharacterized protein LOC144125926 [Amblyomma americanum]
MPRCPPYENVTSVGSDCLLLVASQYSQGRSGRHIDVVCDFAMDPELEKRLREATAVMGLEPYAFTPFRDPQIDDISDSPAGSPDSPCGRENDSVPWFTCGCCESMPTVDEQLCCRSVPQVVNEQGDGCITGHPAFESVCCTPQVLRAVYIALAEENVDNTRHDDDVNK